MYKLENTKLPKNLTLIKNFKSYIRFNFSKDLFIIEENNNFNIFLKVKSKSKSRKKKVQEDNFEDSSKEATLHLNNTKELKHKRYNPLVINANISRNPLKSINTGIIPIANFFKKSVDVKKVKIIKPLRAGFSVVSREGVVGFLHKKEIMKAIKWIVFFFKSKPTTVSILSLWKSEHSVLRLLKIEFLTKLKKIKFTTPKIKRSPKYFVPKHGGKFRISFDEILKTKNKKIEIKDTKCKKPKKNLSNN